MPELQNLRGVQQGLFKGTMQLQAGAGSRRAGFCMASARGENAKKSIAHKKVSPARAAPSEICELQPLVGHTDPDARPDKSSRQS